MRIRLSAALGRRGVVALCILVASVLVTACGGGNTRGSTAQLKCNNLGTLTPGTIAVSIESYLPYSGLDKNGKLTGLDGDILTIAAQNLGCELSISVTDFAGTLAAVHSRRADMTLGSVGWSALRAQSGLFTDPPYYSASAMIEKKGTHITTLSQLEGKSIGGLIGGLNIPAIKAIPGATLKTYTTDTTGIDDVIAGRVDVYMAGDPLVAVYTIKTNPSLDIEGDYLTPPTDAELAAHPDYKYFEPYMTGFYIAKSETALEKALTQQILSLYKNGTEARLVSQWGGDPQAFLTPLAQFTAERVGVDRPEGWQAPSAEG